MHRETNLIELGPRLAAIAMVAFFSTPAFAESQFVHQSAMLPSSLPGNLSIFLQPVSVQSGSTNDFLDVILTNTGTQAVTIGGFAFGLTTSNPGITFTGVTTETTLASYIFAGYSAFGPAIDVSPSPLMASDIFSIPDGGTALNIGQSLGLGHVLFDVRAKAALGPTPVSFLVFPDTSLSDSSGNDLSFTAVSGEITVTPEPRSALMMGGALGVLLCIRSRHRRA